GSADGAASPFSRKAPTPTAETAETGPKSVTTPRYGPRVTVARTAVKANARSFDPLVRSPPFRSLPASVLEELQRHARLKSFARGQSLYRRGEAVTRVLVLGSGAVRLGVVASDGREIGLHLLGPPEAIGIAPMLDGAPFPAEVRGHSPGIVFSVTACHVRDLVERSPPFAAAVARSAAA